MCHVTLHWRSPGFDDVVKTEFNVKWSFEVIQSHVFCGEWKGEDVLNNTAA